jgi:uncharacterized membrane protein
MELPGEFEMTRSQPDWTENKFEQMLGNFLRGGVIVSSGIVMVGGILYLLRHGMETPNYKVFHGEPAEFRELSEIFRAGLTLQRRRSLIQIGMLVLIATPILRVAFAGYVFAKQGDRTYVVITFIVLTILIYSFFQV